MMMMSWDESAWSASHLEVTAAPDSPEGQRQLGVYAISLDGLGIHEDNAPQDGRIVPGERYLASR